MKFRKGMDQQEGLKRVFEKVTLRLKVKHQLKKMRELLEVLFLKEVHRHSLDSLKTLLSLTLNIFLGQRKLLAQNE